MYIIITNILNVTFNLFKILQTITDASIRNITMRCPNLRQLCVSKCSELTDQTLISLANYNPLLSTLEVAGCHQFTDIGFQALGKVCISCLFFWRQSLVSHWFYCRTANISREWTWKNVLKLQTWHSLI